MVATPALRRLALDARVGPRAIRVYVILAEELDLVQYRPVKLLPVSTLLRIKRSKVSEALKALVALGYLDRNGRAWPGGPFTYRLVHVPLRDEVPLPGTPRFD